MRTRWWIGNDVVDLAEPGAAGKERDRRFMDRVFTPSERAHILDSAAPTIALWKTWAAKEAAYKIAAKLREGVVFAHRAFEVEPDRWPSRRARVRFEHLDIRVRWVVARDYVHCIGHLASERAACAACPPKAGGGAAEWWRLSAGILREGQLVDGQLTTAEQASVHSTPSERARLLARRLVERWDVHGAEIVRLWRSWGWSPPVVARDGAPLTAFDVSLSHDGRFVAAAVLGPA
ncbi:MAG: 4'-phosphopantetheinyl transferase superfamily protein [Acidobacteria bacterium]|nr:4'-phosphopantetheinyl transferase superfamily protein [Acidobacteriota bacterium]